MLPCRWLGACLGFSRRVLWPRGSFGPGGAGATSYYETAKLRSTLERLVDFDRINSGSVRFTVGAVNVRSGNLVCFDTETHRIGPEHVMASGALPPGFPAVEIEGEHYWDGGLVSNTPLEWVVENVPRQDTLAFQVDLWSARGDFPRHMAEVETRQKEVIYSSRTRASTSSFKRRANQTFVHQQRSCDHCRECNQESLSGGRGDGVRLAGAHDRLD